MSAQTFWNGVATPARRVLVRVGRAPRSTWWCAKHEGEVRKAVEVTYGDQIFFLDDENGSGWNKVTIGQGDPWIGHSSLPADSVVVEARS